MPVKLNYRLGLDLGTNSIGWAVLPLNDDAQPKAIAKAGVRIFSDGRHPKTGASLAVDRRSARQMRRRRDRLIKRTKRLVRQLVEFGFLPSEQEQRRSLATLDPYMLRAKGLDKPLEPFEFGRIVLLLSKRRGFKSNRKTDKQDNDLGVMSLAIKTLQDKLEVENCRTIGEWLAKRHEQGLSVRARLRGTTKADKAYDFYADRAMTEHEFDTLWAVQSEFQPKLFTAAARETLRDTLLFQRELLPVNPGRCTLLPDEYRAPLALPSVQQVRILQELNNLRLVGVDQSERTLTLTERDVVRSALSKQKSITFAKIKTLLKLPRSARFNLEGAKRSTLKGDLTEIILADKNVLGSYWTNMKLQAKDDLVSLLLNEPSEIELIEKLVQEYDFSSEQASCLANLSFQEGYGRLSLKAIDAILPELSKAVITYAAAVEQSGLGSHSALSNLEKTGEILTKLPYYGEVLQRHVAFEKPNPENDEQKFGKIANPTVHICLNQLRVVVNSLIERYGLPAQINVEVTRDLKLSKRLKDDIDKDQAKRQKENSKNIEEACELLGLDPDLIGKSKRREISQKMQLWRELNVGDCANRRCPYSGEQISITKLLSPEIEIEHILPFSRTLDDSMANKTLSTSRANREKGNRTPWEAFGNHPDFHYEEILQRVSVFPLNKARRFSENGLETWEGKDGFLARALNDTAYISKISRSYLSSICPPSQIQAIPGRLTSMIRGKLRLNDLLVDNKGEKNRDDHRHHAIDAIVVGITERSFLANIAKANSRAVSAGTAQLIDEMPQPWVTFYDHAKRSVSEIITSHRPDHSYQGIMMQDTAWGVLEDGKVKKRVLDEATGEKRAVVENKKVIGVTEPRMDNRHGVDSEGNSVAYKGYIGNSNYCIEIYKEGKKWKGEVVSTYEAYQTIRKLGEVDGFKKLRNKQFTLSGKPLVMRLNRDDLVSLVHGERKILARLAVIKKSGEMNFSQPNEANVDARNRSKELRYISKSAGSLQTSNARYCTVSPAGKVRKISNREVSECSDA